MFETFIRALFIGWGVTAGVVIALMVLALGRAIGEGIDVFVGGVKRRAKRRRDAEARRSAEACGFEKEMRSW